MGKQENTKTHSNDSISPTPLRNEEYSHKPLELLLENRDGGISIRKLLSVRCKKVSVRCEYAGRKHIILRSKVVYRGYYIGVTKVSLSNIFSNASVGLINPITTTKPTVLIGCQRVTHICSPQANPQNRHELP